MLVIDCTDCFTRVEFKQSTLINEFEKVEQVLTDKKDEIRMFAVDDYIFEFVEYISDAIKSPCGVQESKGDQQVIGKYITPVPHLTYMVEEEIQFKITKESIDKFTFFFDDEIVISMHGMLFCDGEFKENLIHKYNINEIRNLPNELCDYIMKKYNEEKKPIYIQNYFKCIGIYTEKKGK